MNTAPPDKDCQTCRRRRIRCDRTVPGCLKCASRSLECPGYGLDIKWVQGAVAWHRTRRSQSSTRASTSATTATASRAETSVPLPPRPSTNPPSNQPSDEEPTIPLSSSRPDWWLKLDLPPSMATPTNYRLAAHYTTNLVPRLMKLTNLGCDKFWREMTLLAASYSAAMYAVLAYTVNDLLLAKSPAPTAEQAEQLRQTRQSLNDQAVRYLSEDMAVMTSIGSAFFEQHPRRARAMIAAMLMLARTQDSMDEDNTRELHVRAMNAMVNSWSNAVGKDALNDPFIHNVLEHLGKEGWQGFDVSGAGEWKGFPQSDPAFDF